MQHNRRPPGTNQYAKVVDGQNEHLPKAPTKAVESRVRSTRILAKLGKFKRYEKRLTVTAWGDARPILDLRYWDISTPEATPGKGLTLTHDEARKLADALSAYLEE